MESLDSQRVKKDVHFFGDDCPSLPGMYVVNWLFQLWDRVSIIYPPPPPPKGISQVSTDSATIILVRSVNLSYLTVSAQFTWSYAQPTGWTFQLTFLFRV
jgi:hypothetical protein